MIKKILVLVFCSIVSLTVMAQDVLDASKNHLVIPLVSAYGSTYSNVEIQISDVVAINGGEVNSFIDIYEPSTNRLYIPLVLAYGNLYSNVIITVGKVVSVGGVVQSNEEIQNIFRKSVISTTQLNRAFNSLSSTSLKGWNWSDIALNANKNIYMCDPSYWSSNLTDNGMPSDQSSWPKELRILGTDLKSHQANNSGATTRIYRELNRYIFSNDPLRLKNVMLSLAREQSFTSIENHTFLTSGGETSKSLASYPKQAEGSTKLSFTLLATSLAYSALQNNIENSELNEIKVWGDKIGQVIYLADDGIDLEKTETISGAADRAASIALGFSAWGLSTQNLEFTLWGGTITQRLIEHLDQQSRVPKFMAGHSNNEVHYHNAVLTPLTYVAHLFRAVDIDLFKIKNLSSGNLLDGMTWVINRYLKADSRTDIPALQNEISISRARFAYIGTLAGPEAMLAYPQLPTAYRNIALEGMKVREKSTVTNTIQGYGFYDHAAPGYSSCFFSVYSGDKSFIPASRSVWINYVNSRNPTDLMKVEY